MLAYYDPKLRFTRTQLISMLTLQCAANDVMSDAWRTSCNCTIQYYRAAWKEASEGMDHIGWKWWKKFNADLDQMRLELIDILHFALSHYVRDAFVAYTDELDADYVLTDDDLAEVYGNAADTILEGDYTVVLECVGRLYSEDAYEKIEYVEEGGPIDITKFDFNDLFEQFIFASIKTGEPNWAILTALFDKAELDADYLYGVYVAKNALNIFRTKNGQRQNDYYKMWDGREDNEFMTEYLNSFRDSGAEVVVDDLMAYMQTSYEGHKIAGTVQKA